MLECVMPDYYTASIIHVHVCVYAYIQKYESHGNHFTNRHLHLLSKRFRVTNSSIQGQQHCGPTRPKFMGGDLGVLMQLHQLIVDMECRCILSYAVGLFSPAHLGCTSSSHVLEYNQVFALITRPSSGTPFFAFQSTHLVNFVLFSCNDLFLIHFTVSH